MSISSLVKVVDRLAESTLGFSDALLGNETYAWDAYEGIRYAHLHTYLTLRALAVEVIQARVRAGRSASQAQAILAQHHVTFRRFCALFLGLSDEEAAMPPAPREWPVRTPILHVYDAERAFLGSILLGLRAHRAGEVVDPEALEVFIGSLGEEMTEMGHAPLADLLAAYGRLHAQVIAELSDVADAEMSLTTPFWEPDWLPIIFRMLRFDTHIAEHTNQVEKTLLGIGKAPSEAKRLMVQIYTALGELEGALIGAKETGADRLQVAADELNLRVNAMLAGAQQARSMVAAVKGGDLAGVQALLAANPATVNATDDADQFVIMTALYAGKAEIVKTLMEADAYLDVFAAAALGKSQRVTKILTRQADEINAFAKDGYTPLQLACFFGREETVRHLLAAGADVHAVARNHMRIQPLHAAVANDNLAIVRMLIEHGAEVNAVQQGDFTPLMGARQNQNQAMIDLLIEHGATE